MAQDNRYNKSPKKIKKPSRKRLIMFVVLGIILLAGLLFILDRKDVINLPFLPNNKPAPVPSSPNGINYGPPTEQEVAETEEFKNKQGDESQPSTAPSTPTSTKKSVTPIMTSWGASPNVEVRGFIPGISEKDGVCTLTLTRDGQKVTESKTATPDATTVSCGLITIARSRVSAGKWAATLSYASKSSEGVSASNTIELE